MQACTLAHANWSLQLLLLVAAIITTPQVPVTR
jgi:hypothetical protein